MNEAKSCFLGPSNLVVSGVATKRGVGHGLGHGVGHGVGYPCFGSRLRHKSSTYFSTCLFVVNTGCSEFAPRQKGMFWGHTLKEQGIVVFAWFQCFVCFERPPTRTELGLVTNYEWGKVMLPWVRAPLMFWADSYLYIAQHSSLLLTNAIFRIDKTIIRIVHKIIQSNGSNESTTLLSTWWSLMRCNFRIDNST